MERQGKDITDEKLTIIKVYHVIRGCCSTKSVNDEDG